MDANEYLEKIVAESYKREIDQEENVVRSLPFVAVTLAVLSTIMIVLKSYIPEYSLNIYPFIVWLMLIAFGMLIMMVIYFLHDAVRHRSFQYVAPADQLYTYATQLRLYYGTLGKTPEEIEQGIIEDARILMIEQYAIGATYNQQINIDRSRARARAFSSLLLALALAYGIVVTISAHEVVKGSGSGTIIFQGGGTKSAPFPEKPVPPPTQRIIKGEWTYRAENPKEQSESALKALKERAQALKELSQEIKSHSEFFVRSGPRMLTPSETNARQQQIEELATKIEKLADSGPRQDVTYRDVEKILRNCEN